MHCADADVPELARLATTIDSWRTELLAYFDTGRLSNGPTKQSTCSSRRLNASATDFRTSTTTDSASYCTAESNGTLLAPPRSEADYHASLRRAGNSAFTLELHGGLSAAAEGRH